MKYTTYALALALLALLSTGCSDDDPVPPAGPTTYTVTITNATNNQPLSPVAVIVHRDGYSPVVLNTSASAGLELLAEGGDNSDLLSEADASEFVANTNSGTGPIGPGASEEIEVSVPPGGNYHISVVTMLVNTNDAITALVSEPVANVEGSETLTRMTRVYDAGTEANSETAATIPGPAGGGEGFNATRNDNDRVHVHSGIITANEGKTGSALTESHKFDQPAMLVRIARN